MAYCVKYIRNPSPKQLLGANGSALTQGGFEAAAQGEGELEELDFFKTTF